MENYFYYNYRICNNKHFGKCFGGYVWLFPPPTHTHSPGYSWSKKKGENILIKHQANFAQGLNSGERPKLKKEPETATSHRMLFSGSGGFQLQSYETEAAPRSQGNLSKRYCCFFFLWTYGITAPDGWRVIWEQNRHLLLMQMSLLLWVAGDLQESWHFCRFQYLVDKAFQKEQRKVCFNTQFCLENPKHVVSKQCMHT